MWSDSGYGWVPAWKRCKVVCTPRNADGKFTTDKWDMEFVTLKDEDGRTFQASMEDVEPDRDIQTLSREELVKLWGKVCKGSIYLCDYRNSLGVFEDVAVVVDDRHARGMLVVERAGRVVAQQEILAHKRRHSASPHPLM